MAHVLTDMRYGADERHRLDLYLPERPDDAASAPAPLFFFIHGGGWRGGDKSEYRPLAEVLAGFGYAVAMPNHRFAPDHAHPAQIEDVADALSFVLRGAEEAGVSPRGACLAGHSSGGHLAALLALHPQYRSRAGAVAGTIAGVVSLCGIYDLAPFAGDEYFFPPFGADPSPYPAASPISYVAADPPPFFLAYAECDYPGADAQADAMAERLAAAGGRARTFCVPGRNHFTILSGARSMLDPLAVQLALFLRSLRG